VHQYWQSELSLTLEVKICLKTVLTNFTTTTFGLELHMPRMHSIARYRSNNKIMIYFIVANDNGERKINLSIPLVLLLAKIHNERTHSVDFMHIFSNYDCDVKYDLR
jgi:hypothetical protein